MKCSKAKQNHIIHTFAEKSEAAGCIYIMYKPCGARQNFLGGTRLCAAKPKHVRFLVKIFYLAQKCKSESCATSKQWYFYHTGLLFRANRLELVQG